MYFNADFAMQTSSEYIKYDIEEYCCPKSSISMRKVHVNTILIKHCYSRSLTAPCAFITERISI